MRELEGQLQRLRQVLFDMLQTPTQQHDWLDWTERFHAALLYLHQAGVVCERPEVGHRLQSLLLNPNPSNNGNSQLIPDVLFRTKLDNVDYATDGVGQQNERGFKDRAGVLLERLEGRDHAASQPVSPLAGVGEGVDYALLKLYYSGVE